MPLLPEVEAVIKEYAPEHQSYMRDYYEKHPDLQTKVKEQVMAQSEFSRRVQVTSDKEKEAIKRKAEADALHAKNLDWFRDSEAEHNQLQTENRDLKGKVSDLETRIRAAAGASGGVPTAEIEKLLSELNGVKTKLDDTQKQLKDSETKVAQRFDSGGMFLVEIEDLADQYAKEFGESFNRKEFIKYMNDNKVNDPQAAYKEMTGQRRIDKAVADATKKGEEEGRKKAEAEFQAKQAQPYATGAGGIENGPLQQFLKRGEKDPQTPGQGAAAAAAELISEGRM